MPYERLIICQIVNVHQNIRIDPQIVNVYENIRIRSKENYVVCRGGVSLCDPMPEIYGLLT